MTFRKNLQDRPRATAWETCTLLLLIATALGLFFTGQIYFSAASFGHPVSWGQALYWSFGDWYEWALLAPVIFWLCRRFPLDRRFRLKSLALYCFCGLVLASVHAAMCGLAAVFQAWLQAQPAVWGAEFRKLLAGRGHYNLAVYAVIVSAWYAWDYRRKLRERELQAADLAARLAQAQLHALRMQLNPHFLCNALNAVSSLMLTDVTAANKMLSRLAELLRLALENSDKPEITLQQELRMLERYLEIEQIRFGDRLEVRTELDPGTLDAAVPNLILQPLVENAIRHAIEPSESLGRIELRALRDNGNLVMQVSDNGGGGGAPDRMRHPSRDRQSTGIGLRNTRERLRKIYGEMQRFELIENAGGGVTARLSIPFRVAAPPEASL